MTGSAVTGSAATVAHWVTLKLHARKLICEKTLASWSFSSFQDKHAVRDQIAINITGPNDTASRSWNGRALLREDEAFDAEVDRLGTEAITELRRIYSRSLDG
ncbi:hypothetical protein [Microbispora sp. NBC_01389]|uniref:hypothetical protein n=1 Tax=Microbispora sp. NBC_01389 TaxID=2903584 RepID=UPI00324538C2